MWPKTKISRLCPLFLVLTFLAPCQFAVAQKADLRLDQLGRELDQEIESLLLNKDVGAVANQLANAKAETVPELLRNLIVYVRAGHVQRVRQTLARLAESPEWPMYAEVWSVRLKVLNLIDDDLTASRVYFERLCPNADQGAEAFRYLWEKEGNLTELDAWLEARAATNTEWFRILIYRRAKQRTVDEFLDALAAEIRANPGDRERVERYLVGAGHAGSAGHPRNVAWLAEVFQMQNAYEYFEFGKRLQPFSADAAVRLFEKSLRLPFTGVDAKQVEERNKFLYFGSHLVNWDREKQLRYWTKSKLAEAYQALHRSLEAQPIIEELAAMDANNIIKQDLYQLSGGVQMGSGQRVIETGILRNEVTQANTVEYWLDRLDYYEGRAEYKLKHETYHKALTHFPYNSKDEQALARRLIFLRFFAFFSRDSCDARVNCRKELSDLLRREFTTAQPETKYAFQLAQLITDQELELDELRQTLFGEQPKIVARLLNQRAEWDIEEGKLLYDMFRGDAITAQQRNSIWMQLEKLVTDPGSSRAYVLAMSMTSFDAPQRAIPLLRGYIDRQKSAERAGAIEMLFNAHCELGDWQAAERVLLAHKITADLPYRFERLAVVAGRNGSPKDAVRFWRLKTNLDRSDLDGLWALAGTDAKAQLSAMYLQMKQDDPLSVVPDRALRILQSWPYSP